MFFGLDDAILNDPWLTSDEAAAADLEASFSGLGTDFDAMILAEEENKQVKIKNWWE